MSYITNRWDGDCYLTNDQYESTKKYFETKINSEIKINSPNYLNTISTTPITSTDYTGGLVYDNSSTSFKISNPHTVGCGQHVLSDIVEHKSLGFRNIKIKRIIFNPPATVIFWGDDTKTVVKCAEDDEFNPEIGVAMCYMKKIYGSRHAFSKMVEKYEID